MASFASSATTCGARKHAWTDMAGLIKGRSSIMLSAADMKIVGGTSVELYYSMWGLRNPDECNMAERQINPISHRGGGGIHPPPIAERLILLSFV